MIRFVHRRCCASSLSALSQANKELRKAVEKKENPYDMQQLYITKTLKTEITRCREVDVSYDLQKVRMGGERIVECALSASSNYCIRIIAYVFVLPSLRPPNIPAFLLLATLAIAGQRAQYHL